jgi:hypothetical protein
MPRDTLSQVGDLPYLDSLTEMHGVFAVDQEGTVAFYIDGAGDFEMRTKHAVAILIAEIPRNLRGALVNFRTRVVAV